MTAATSVEAAVHRRHDHGAPRPRPARSARRPGAAPAAHVRARPAAAAPCSVLCVAAASSARLNWGLPALKAASSASARSTATTPPLAACCSASEGWAARRGMLGTDSACACARTRQSLAPCRACRTRPHRTMLRSMRFLQACEQALQHGRFDKLLLAGYRGPEPELKRLGMRAIVLRGQPHLSLVYSHERRDVTRNLPVAEGLAELRALLGPAGFGNAHLHTHDEELQLALSRKGRWSLRVGRRASAAPAEAAAGAQPREAAPADAGPPLPGRAGRHRCGAPAGAGDGAQVEADQPLPGGDRRGAGGIEAGHAAAHRGAGLRRRQGLPDLRAARPPAPCARAGCAGHRRGAARGHGEAVQRHRRPARPAGPALRAGRRGVVRAARSGRDDRAACLRHRHRPCHLPRHPRRRVADLLRALLPQAAAPAAAQPAPLAADPAARRAPGPGGRDADRRPARAAARRLRLRHAGLRVRVAGAHRQEQDDPGGEARPARADEGPAAAAGARHQGLLRHPGSNAWRRC